MYEHISECKDYKLAIATLDSIFIKPTNDIFNRHLLATRKQQAGESITEFLAALRNLSKECNYKAVTADAYRSEAMRDAFITGLLSGVIRHRLLENQTLTLDQAVDQARALDQAQRNSETYAVPGIMAAASIKTQPPQSDQNPS